MTLRAIRSWCASQTSSARATSGGTDTSVIPPSSSPPPCLAGTEERPPTTDENLEVNPRETPLTVRIEPGPCGERRVRRGRCRRARSGLFAVDSLGVWSTTARNRDCSRVWGARPLLLAATYTHADANCRPTCARSTHIVERSAAAGGRHNRHRHRPGWKIRRDRAAVLPVREPHPTSATMEHANSPGNASPRNRVGVYRARGTACDDNGFGSSQGVVRFGAIGVRGADLPFVIGGRASGKVTS